MNQSCLSCNTGQDTQLVMKMFKVACLSYKAAEVMYRGHSISRDALISLRRDLIEKVTLNMI
jgi:hypothetical protein